jgi:hypothetical protein
MVEGRFPPDLGGSAAGGPTGGTVSADFAPDHFERRFLVPAVPLLGAGGTVALRDLLPAVPRQRVPNR